MVRLPLGKYLSATWYAITLETVLSLSLWLTTQIFKHRMGYLPNLSCRDL